MTRVGPTGGSGPSALTGEAGVGYEGRVITPRRPTRRAPAGPVGLAAAAILALALALAGCSSGTSAGTATSTSTVARTAAAATGPASRLNDWSRIPRIAARVAPSIVTIQTADGLGSGVIWSADGKIVTDAHVVGTSKTVTVAFADGRSTSGTVLATDPVTDLAVLEVSRTHLPAATFERPLPALGDLAVAIGSPLGFTNSVTAGVVSGVGREIPGSAAETQSLVDLLQTDAAISPGNSGGALVDGAGRVIGLVEAYIPPSEGAVALGFAIPSHTVVVTVEQLLASGRASHSYLGITTATITPDLQQELGLTQATGALVQTVARNGPAAAAGIQPGDIVTAAGGRPVTSPEDLIAVLRDHQAGDTIPVTVVRDGAKQTVDVKLAERPRQ
jgi:S1-C subfamily serine protease